MKRQDSLWLSGLALMALWIWLRDLGWTHQYQSTLPILFSFAWFGWLMHPWKTIDQTKALSTPSLAVSLVFAIVGIITNTTLLLAIAWTIVLRTWAGTRFAPGTLHKVNRLIILPVMAFPWMTLDGEVLSTFFRLTAAQSAEWIFAQIGFSVERSATNLWIQGLPVTVNEACSGLGVLQTVMIAGIVLLEAFVRNNHHFWMQIPLLIVTAWVANLARVILISIAALTWGPEFAAGPFHTWGGMTALALVFGVAWALIEWQGRSPAQTSSEE